MTTIRKSAIADLKRALEALHAATDPQSTKCAVAPEHREAMRVYLQTWVEHPLFKAIADIEGYRGSLD